MNNIIPESAQIYRTREEASFEDTEENSGYQQASEVLDNAHHSHNDTPADNEYSEVIRGTLKSLQKHVRWDFEEDIWHEENGQYDVPLNAIQSEIFNHSFDFSILHRSTMKRSIRV